MLVAPVHPSGSSAPTQAGSQSAATDISLLPPPAAGVLPADPLLLLYLYESKDQTAGVDAGSNKLAGLERERHDAIAQEQSAIQRAMEAESSHTFWDSLGDVFGEVAKVAAVVASVAAAVATAGAATPLAALAIAGAALSSAGFIDGELHVLRGLGVDDRAAGWVDFGLSIGGAACSVGVGLAAGVKASARAAWALAKAATVVAGIGDMGKSAGTIGAGLATAHDDAAQADEIAAKASSDHLARMVLLLLDRTKDSDGESRHIQGTIANTKTIENDTTLSVASMRG